MPYEIASAAVRTLAIQCSALSSAKTALQQCQATDPNLEKAGSLKAQDALTGLQDCTRYIVMNKRTGQIATQEFIAKSIKEENGKPVFKKANSKIQPWIMSLKYRQVGLEAELELRLTNSTQFRKLRCLDLKTGERRGKIIALMESYPDMMDGNFDGAESEAESVATMIGDEDGLQGQSVMLGDGRGQFV